jgi:hypothetical protein
MYILSQKEKKKEKKQSRMTVTENSGEPAVPLDRDNQRYSKLFRRSLGSGEISAGRSHFNVYSYRGYPGNEHVVVWWKETRARRRGRVGESAKLPFSNGCELIQVLQLLDGAVEIYWFSRRRFGIWRTSHGPKNARPPQLCGS